MHLFQFKFEDDNMPGKPGYIFVVAESYADAVELANEALEQNEVEAVISERGNLLNFIAVSDIELPHVFEIIYPT